MDPERLLARARRQTGLTGLPWVAAQPAAAPVSQSPPIHPQFALLDEAGAPVLISGNPVSTLKTCGACHDTAFIQSHSYHATLGLDEFNPSGQTKAGLDHA